VHFGDTLRVTGRVTEVSPVSDEAGLVTLTWTVVNQDERTVCRARVEVLWRRDGTQPEVPADEYATSGFVPIPL
jgi:acyl dehydratase